MGFLPPKSIYRDMGRPGSHRYVARFNAIISAPTLMFACVMQCRNSGDGSLSALIQVCRRLQGPERAAEPLHDSSTDGSPSVPVLRP